MTAVTIPSSPPAGTSRCLDDEPKPQMMRKVSWLKVAAIALVIIAAVALAIGITICTGGLAAPLGVGVALITVGILFPFLSFMPFADLSNEERKSGLSPFYYVRG